MLPQDLPWLADGYKSRIALADISEMENIRSTETDSFALLPEDGMKPFTQRRVKSASTVRPRSLYHRSGSPGPAIEMFRSDSAAPPTPENPPTAPRRRVQSAGLIREKYMEHLRKGFTLVNKLYENERLRSTINLHPASPAPDYRYFDRHSRCFDHTHLPATLVYDRPQSARVTREERCFVRSRPWSAAARTSKIVNKDPMCQPKRYINYHRPKTAPEGMRRDIPTSLRQGYLNRGRTPRFCNFVHQAQIHLSSHSPPRTRITAWEGSDHGDYCDLSNLSTTSSAIGFHPPHTGSDTSSIHEQQEDILIKGTEGRPVSPRSAAEESIKDDTRLTVGDKSAADSEIFFDSKPKVAEATEVLPSDDLVSRSSSIKNVDSTSEGLNTMSEWGNDKKYKIPTIFIPSGHRREDDNLLPLSPTEPPPSPELVKPRAPDKTIRGSKRSCVSKKNKKLIERSRQARQEMDEIKLDVAEQLNDKPPSPPPPSSDSVSREELQVDISLPDLPSLEQEETSRSKSQSTAERHLIEVSSETPKTETNDTSEEPLLQPPQSEFDWSTMDNNVQEDVTPKKQTRVQSWIQGRLALSQQSSRFELPMDMRLLETLSPQDYVKKYCIISSRRQNLYQKIFLKNKDKSGVILFKDLDRSLKDVMVNTINKEQIEELVEMLQISEETRIDYKLFSGMTALAERVLYPKFVTEDTADMPEYQKEKIECADFCALDWKFHGVNINPPIKKLLKKIE